MTRAEKVAEAQRLRAEGLKIREICERMGAPRGTVAAWLSDPDLSKHYARRAEYATTCMDCGAPTNGAAPALRCAECAKPHWADHLNARWAGYRELVEQLWANGFKIREIREITGHTLNITTLRKQGYNLPYRRRGAGGGGTAERMAYARSKRRSVAA